MLFGTRVLPMFCLLVPLTGWLLLLATAAPAVRPAAPSGRLIIRDRCRGVVIDDRMVPVGAGRGRAPDSNWKG